MNRSFIQMLAGAAGLMAAFIAMSLPLLFSWDAAFSKLAAGGAILLGTRLLLAVAAIFLLRFFLSHEDTGRPLRFHSGPVR